MVGPTHSSPTLGTPGRLHRHAAIAHRERMPIGAVVPVARTLKALRHGSVYSRLLHIRHRRVECRVAQHFLRCGHFLRHAGCLTRVGVADGASEVELVSGAVDERGRVCVREAGRAAALKGDEAGPVQETLHFVSRLLPGSRLLH